MNIFLGPLLALQALRLLLSSRRLILKAFIPGLVASVSTGAIFYLFYESMPKVRSNFSWVFDSLEEYLGGGAIDFTFSVVLTFILAPFLVLIIALPLCEPLAAEIDSQGGGQELEVSMISGLFTGVASGLKLVVIGLSVSLILSILSLIPLIGFIAGAFNLFIWTPLILCFDVTDFVFSRRGLNSVSQRIKLLLSAPLSTSSVGFMVIPLLGTPFLNLIGAPIAVIVGTLYARSLEHKIK